VELKRINEVSPRHPYVVFRNSVLHSLIPFFCILVPLGFLCYYLVKQKDFPGWLDGGLQGLASAVAFLSIRPVIKSFSPSNWLMQTEFQRVYIKIRSYLNTKVLPDEKLVIELKDSEIKWVRRTQIKLASMNLKQKTVSRLTYLDICLKQPVFQEIKTALEYEKKFTPKKDSSKYDYYPVVLIEPDILRVKFSGVSPSVNKAIKILNEMGAIVHPKNKEEIDTTVSSASLKPAAEKDSK
jgi:hypothetical protein